MSLENYRAPTHTVPLTNGQSITVRALTLPDFAAIAQEHGSDLAALGELLKRESWASADAAALAQQALVIAPDVVAQALALAADEPDAADAVGKLPLPVVVLALVAVVRLTLESVGGLPGLAAVVVDLFGDGADTAAATPAVGA